MRLKVVLGVIGAAVFTALIKRAVTPFYVPEAESILPSFEEVQPGLYSLQTRWKPLWGLLTVPTAIFAVKLDGDYLLVDSGGEAAEEFVADAVKHLLGSRDRLAAIFYTHAHFEHIGGTARLLQDHPDVLHIIHEDEMPFLTTSRRHIWEPTDNWTWAISRYIAALFKNPLDTLPNMLPRTAILRGRSGDLADITIKHVPGTSPEVTWAPQRGVVQWLHVPGHAPGLSLLLHVPSKSIIAGDVFKKDLDNDSPKLDLLPVLNASQAASSVKALADWGDWQRAYPSHEAPGGVSHALVSEYAGSL